MKTFFKTLGLSLGLYIMYIIIGVAICYFAGWTPVETESQALGVLCTCLVLSIVTLVVAMYLARRFLPAWPKKEKEVNN